MIYTVQKTMKILRVMARAKNRPVTLSEIVESTGINKSTCSHIISTLLYDGYVIRVSHKLGYIIGPAFYALTKHISYDSKLTSVCHEVIKWINKQFPCTAVLAVIENAQKYIVDYIDSEQHPFVPPIELFNDDIFQTATGRILASNLRRYEFDKVIERHGLPKYIGKIEIRNSDQLYKNLESIKKEKIVKVCSVRNNIYVHNYAFGIYRDARCIASIGVTVYTENDFISDEKMIYKTLATASDKICQRMK